MTTTKLQQISMIKQNIFQSRGQIFTISSRTSNALLASLKNILELEQWTNRKQLVNKYE
jgi:hypothetical protein